MSESVLKSIKDCDKKQRKLDHVRQGIICECKHISFDKSGRGMNSYSLEQIKGSVWRCNQCGTVFDLSKTYDLNHFKETVDELINGLQFIKMGFAHTGTPRDLKVAEKASAIQFDLLNTMVPAFQAYSDKSNENNNKRGKYNNDDIGTMTNPETISRY